MPMRVLHSCWSWLPITQNWIYGQVRNLPSEVVEAHVACQVTDHPDRFPWPHLHVARPRHLPRRAADLLRRYVGCARRGHTYEVAKAIGCDILHSHFGDQAWNDLPASAAFDIPHLATFYGYDVNQLPRGSATWRRRYAELFAVISGVLCEGPHMALSLRDLGCPEEKLRVQPLGIDLGQWPFVPRQWSGDSPLRVLIAASFREKKGIPYAVAALGRLARDIPLALTIAGDAGRDRQSVAEKRRIVEAVCRGGLNGVTRFLGMVDHATLQSLAYQHDVFVSPSITASDGDTEGGAPVAIIEMLASGMPVVATRHCDIPFVVGPQGAQLLAAERDAAGLERCLRWLLAEGDWGSIIRSCREHIVRQHDAVRQGEVLAGLYREFVEPSG